MKYIIDLETNYIGGVVDSKKVKEHFVL